MLGRERHERQQVFLGGLQQLADLRRDRRQPGENVGQAAAGLGAIGGVEDLAQRGRHQPALGGTTVAVHVAHEVHAAALPRRVEDPRDRRLQALVMVGDHESQTGQAAGPRKSSVQNASDSTSPRSMPITSRRPLSWTAQHLNAVEHRYLDHAIEQLRADGYPVLDADVARLSPYMRRHINFHGHYSFAPTNLGGRAHGSETIWTPTSSARPRSRNGRRRCSARRSSRSSSR